MFKKYVKYLTLVLLTYSSCFNNAISSNLKLSKQYFEKGLKYQRDGQEDKAILFYTKAIEQNPKNIEALENRGFVYTEDIDNNEKAISDFSKVIILDPKNTTAYTSRASCYAIAGNFKLALVDLNKAIELYPNDSQTFEQRADVNIRLSNFKQAISDLKQAQKLAPDLYQDAESKKHLNGEIAECEKFIKNNYKFDDQQFTINGEPLKCIH